MALHVLVDGVPPRSTFVGSNIAALDRKETYFKSVKKLEERKLNGSSVFCKEDFLFYNRKGTNGTTKL